MKNIQEFATLILVSAILASTSFTKARAMDCDLRLYISVESTKILKEALRDTGFLLWFIKAAELYTKSPLNKSFDVFSLRTDLWVSRHIISSGALLQAGAWVATRDWPFVEVVQGAVHEAKQGLAGTYVESLTEFLNKKRSVRGEPTVSVRDV